MNVVIVVMSPLLQPRLHDEGRRHLMHADEVGGPTWLEILASQLEYIPQGAK